MGFEKRGGLVLLLLLPVAVATSHAQQGPPVVAPVRPHPVLATVNGVEVYDAGYGSGIAPDPTATGYFYLLADRGPNYDAGKDTKAFVEPGFTPRIGRFHLGNGVLTQVARIEMSTPDGRPLTGIPPLVGAGGTGETALSTDGSVIPLDPQGIDPEGLVALKGGGFWISEEYGPGLVHLDATGRVLERISPYSGGTRVLPQVLKKRRANRGLEGLALLPDGRTLVGIVEGPLDNPKATARKSVISRLVSFDTRTGTTRQYVYLQEEVDDRNSDLAAIDQNRLLVIERDGNMPGDSTQPARVKRVYRIDLRGATDVSDPADGTEGRLFNGRSLESLTPAELQSEGIMPVKKELVVDLLAIGYRHDKPEGVAVVDARTIAVSNDDDFGITEGPAPKLLPKLGVADFSEVYFIKLPSPLR